MMISQFSHKRIGRALGLLVLSLALVVGSGMAGGQVDQQPKVEFLKPLDRAVLRDTIELAVRASGFVGKDGNIQGTAEFEYSIDAQTFRPLLAIEKSQGNIFSINWNSNSLYDNRYFLRATVTDQAGNRASAQIIVTVSNEFVYDQLIVRFTKETTPESANTIAARVGAKVIDSIDFDTLGKVYYQLQIVQDQSVLETLRLLDKESAVEYVAPNPIMKPASHQVYPDDPYFLNGAQWGLLNAGQSSRKGVLGVIDADIDIPQAWTLKRDCTSIGVAVIDSGINSEHEDLQGVEWMEGLDLTEPGKQKKDGGKPRDLGFAAGHGTFVAGIIGAVGNNGKGIAGICWRAKLMSIAVFGGAPDKYRLAKAIRYAVSKGARIINMSLGGKREVEAVLDALREAESKGVLAVTIAGNDGMDITKGEPIYIDENDDGVVNPGDERLHEIRNPDYPSRGQSSIKPGKVQAGDPDVGGKPLTPFLAGFHRYLDNNNDGQYDAGDHIYLDEDDNRKISTGDSVLKGVLSGNTVNRFYPDFGKPLKDFDPKVKYLDQGQGWQAFPGRYDVATLFPCLYKFLANAICVAASDRQDRLASFSNYGFVDLAAPGEAMTSLDVKGGVIQEFEDGELFVLFKDDTTREQQEDIIKRLGTEILLNLSPFYRLKIVDGTPTLEKMRQFQAQPEVSEVKEKAWDGTSFAAPHVTGVAALCWSLLPNLSAAQLKQLILQGVDRKPEFTGAVVSGGRLRWPCNRDSGDAPDENYGTKWDNRNGPRQGPLHLDNGNEWLEIKLYQGSSPGVSSEYNETDPNRDPDGVHNLNPEDTDLYDDGIQLIPPPPWRAGDVVQVIAGVCSDYVGRVDAEGGRYGGRRQLWLNAWFDWNGNRDFLDPGEHVIVSFKPTVPSSGSESRYPPPTTCWTERPPAIKVPRDVLGTIWMRFRLDYMEDSGARSPIGILPAQTNFNAAVYRPVGIQLPPDYALKPEPHGAALFGEVEDYCITKPTPIKIVDTSEIIPGGLLTYTITLRNPNSCRLKGISIFDPLPSPLIFGVLTQAPAGVSFNTNTNALEGSFDVEPATEAKIIYTATAKPDLPVGTPIINCVTFGWLGFTFDTCSPPTVIAHPKKPDLFVPELKIQLLHVKVVGGKKIFQVKIKEAVVKNQGEGDAAPSQFQAAGISPAAFLVLATVPALPSGQSFNAPINQVIELHEGQVQAVVAAVDSGNQVQESDEANNSRTFLISCFSVLIANKCTVS